MADEFDEHGQCVVCAENLSAEEPGYAFPCCGATYCPACARETVENECCAECFKEIDAQGDVDGYVAALPAHDAAFERDASFGAFDEDGLPQADAAGESLSKSARKKLLKARDKHAKLHAAAVDS